MTSSAPSPLSSISPLFIVGDLAESVAFSRDQLGFEVALPLPEVDPFFAIVRRRARCFTGISRTADGITFLDAGALQRLGQFDVAAGKEVHKALAHTRLFSHASLAMLFRPLQPDDADFYRHVRRRALAEVPQFVGPLAEREAAMELDELRHQLAVYPAAGVHVFGCFMNGEGAAVAAMTRKLDPKYAHKLFLWGMFVLPSYRRHSLGQHFVTHLVGFARQQSGVRFITLQVTTTNAPARALYQRHGFVSYGVEPCALLLNGSLLDFEMMQLDLKGTGGAAPTWA